jgi:Asp-tRNA(Asn)/Glu-tRNA(Gln) amidotransferase A subunit family amidase
MNLAQFTNQIATTGGGIYNIVRGEAPTSGYGASHADIWYGITIPETWESMTIEERGLFLKPHINQFIAQNGRQFEVSWDYMSAYTQDDLIILEMTRVFDELYDAILFGIVNYAEVIHDYAKDESIELPTGQTHGTMTQVMNYAKMVAMVLTDKILTNA